MLIINTLWSAHEGVVHLQTANLNIKSVSNALHWFVRHFAWTLNSPEGAHQRQNARVRMRPIQQNTSIAVGSVKIVRASEGR